MLDKVTLLRRKKEIKILNYTLNITIITLN
jgi:hypothetical protein